MENATQKIKANYLRTLVLQECADLMYGGGLLDSDAAVRVALDRFQHMKQRYSAAKSFFAYFETTWIPKLNM